MIEYRKLPTEQSNPASGNLDALSALEIVRLMNRENQRLSLAIAQAEQKIAQAIDCIAQSLRARGRLFFIGAGTSGRLGVIEAAECPPTFNTTPAQVRAFMAGGRKAVFKSQEGAEDNVAAAKKIIAKQVRAQDVLVGIAVSGVTPFVRAALAQARRKKAKTIFITCNAQAQVAQANILIALPVGPEILTGSSRLKAGSVTKMVLNMLTTGAMAQLGKMYGNRMVDVQPKSRKLRERGIALVENLGGVRRSKALALLKSCNWRVKVAIVMARKNLTAAQAQKLLQQHQGFLARALKK